jgi:uncharacterized caspase-like protein/outer membrane biosynthesis protein TonB
LGFQVQMATDVDRRGLLAALRDFEARARGAEVALFYFAGHGAQVGGANYLIPVNAQIRSETDVPDEALYASSVLRRIEEGRARVGLVILDACRDNPYPGSARSSTRGLARMSAPTGTIVAYATAPGSTADDGGSGANGLYTGALVRHLSLPGLDIKEVFDRTAQEVERLSNGKQRPREEIGLRGRFVLNDSTSTPSLASVPPTPLPPGQAGGINLSDLAREQQAREAWANWQRRMQADFESVGALTAPDLRAQAWQRFLGAWKDDNPTSGDDERLREQAEQRLAAAQREVRAQHEARAQEEQRARDRTRERVASQVRPPTGDALAWEREQVARTATWIDAQPESSWLVQHAVSGRASDMLDLRASQPALADARIIATFRSDGRVYFALVSGPFGSAADARSFEEGLPKLATPSFVRSIARVKRELVEPAKPADMALESTPEKPAEKLREKPPEKLPEKLPEKPPEKAPEKAAEKPPERAPEKPAAKAQPPQKAAEPRKDAAPPASTSPTASGRGSAAVDAAPSRAYGGLLVAAIRPNIVYAEDSEANFETEVFVTVLQDGGIKSLRITRPSASRVWDGAVLRAIEKTKRLPSDINGQVPEKVIRDGLIIFLKPRDFSR